MSSAIELPHQALLRKAAVPTPPTGARAEGQVKKFILEQKQSPKQPPKQPPKSPKSPKPTQPSGAAPYHLAMLPLYDQTGASDGHTLMMTVQLSFPAMASLLGKPPLGPGFDLHSDEARELQESVASLVRQRALLTQVV